MSTLAQVFKRLPWKNVSVGSCPDSFKSCIVFANESGKLFYVVGHRRKRCLEFMRPMLVIRGNRIYDLLLHNRPTLTQLQNLKIRWSTNLMLRATVNQRFFWVFILWKGRSGAGPAPPSFGLIKESLANSMSQVWLLIHYAAGWPAALWYLKIRSFLVGSIYFWQQSLRSLSPPQKTIS